MRSKYETHVLPYLERIKIWVAKGATYKEVANKLSVAESTLRKMKGEHPALSAALACGAVADDEVEAALFKRAIGYEYEEVQRYQTAGKDGKLIWLEKRFKRHLPPDPTSIQFWLTNRRPQEWKRMPEAAEEKAGESGVVMLPEVDNE